MQFSEDLFLGSAQVLIPPDPTAPSPQTLGVGPIGRLYTLDMVPVTSGAALLAALQTTAGATPLVLTAGAGVTTQQDATGAIRYVIDLPNLQAGRRITLTSAGNLSAINFLVVGNDIYGQRMSQLIVGPNVGIVTSLKCFKSIISVTPSAAVGTTVSVGFNDAIGLPYVLSDAGYACDPGWAGIFARDAGTLVIFDATNPATSATGDVRGVYTPSSAANGARRLVFGIQMAANQCGPAATRLGAVGVNQA